MRIETCVVIFTLDKGDKTLTLISEQISMLELPFINTIENIDKCT